jgi:flagellin-specific chaperone FliS
MKRTKKKEQYKKKTTKTAKPFTTVMILMQGCFTGHRLAQALRTFVW